eukprot:scaffold86_cov338-Pavlova_lutheri.AAC.124
MPMGQEASFRPRETRTGRTNPTWHGAPCERFEGGAHVEGSKGTQEDVQDVPEGIREGHGGAGGRAQARAVQQAGVLAVRRDEGEGGSRAGCGSIHRRSAFRHESGSERCFHKGILVGIAWWKRPSALPGRCRSRRGNSTSETRGPTERV